MHRFSSERAIRAVCTIAEDNSILVRGRFLDDGSPYAIEITNREIEAAISDVIDQIVQGVCSYVMNVPNSYHGALLTERIILKGEFKNLVELKHRLEKALNKPIIIGEI